MKTYDIEECADFLHISRTHAINLAGSGQLPGAKIGREWVFLESDLVDYLRAEAKKQMMERRAKASVETEISVSVARTPSMVAPQRTRGKGAKPLPDLSKYGV